MLLALTTNPAIDRTMVVPGFRHSEVTRVSERRDAAGGKGLNVVRVAQTLGVPVVACAPLAGTSGKRIAELADAEGFRSCWHWMRQGESRTCLLVTDLDTHDTLVINEQGPEMPPEEWEAFAQLVRQKSAEAQAISFSGSLMPGVAAEQMRKLVLELLEDQRVVYVDTSNAPLRQVLDLPIALLKVNTHELGDAIGRTITTASEALAAAEATRQNGPQTVIVTLGKTGVIGVNQEGAWHATTPPITQVSPVGSGDSVLAGAASILINNGSLPEALRVGIAAGAANALTLGGGVIRQADLQYLQNAATVQRM